MQITFLGAADSVTGSRHLVDTGAQRVLLDCGLFQGFKTLRERNWQPFPVPASGIDAVALSHAHLDHSGYLPALVKQGFRGPVYCSAATAELCAVLLLDSAHLQEEDARRANRLKSSRHRPALPLYTSEDARRAIERLKPVANNRIVQIGGGTSLMFTPVGHLLGASAITLRHEGRTLVFSGDVGRSDDLLMPPPQSLPQADVLLVESTYGDRLHPREDVQARLGAIVRAAVRRGGSVLLPTFAVGRAQALLLALHRLKAAGEIPQDLPVFVDSPMAEKATRIHERHQKLLRIPAREARALSEDVKFVATPQESAALCRARYPRIVLSASGMATGGRVLHHLQAMAPNPKNHIVFPGFQVAGSRGARLVAGEREVKIFGEYVAVKAEVSHLEGFSGHADADELLGWLRHFEKPPARVFVVHGEPAAADALRIRIGESLGWTARVPEHRETVEA